MGRFCHDAVKPGNTNRRQYAYRNAKTIRTIPYCRKQVALSATDLSFFALCIMGFSRFWLNMAVEEIKVHSRVIRIIFPMIQRAKNDRSVQRALPVYDNGVFLHRQKRPITQHSTNKYRVSIETSTPEKKRKQKRSLKLEHIQWRPAHNLTEKYKLKK